jgi:transposase
VFTERFPAVLKPWARRTVRLSTQQTAIGVAVGGLPGERLSTWLGIPLGHNALLRLVRQLPTVSLSSPRIVGIDDWAQCRRNRYGTVVIDLERHRLIALLADRESTTVAQWLREHPTIEVISRDRFNAYIEGASNGAPQATQVADRFHLLRNVADALRKVFDQHAKCIAELDQRRRQARQRSACPMPSLATITPIGTATATEQSQHRRARRLARYERVWQLHRQGFSRAAIAREIGIHRNTVDKFLRSARFPERQARTQRSSVLDPFKAYLLQRWQSGYRNAMQLLREIKSQGYRGQYSILKCFLQAVRRASGQEQTTPSIVVLDCQPALTPSSAVWLVLMRPERQDDDDRQQIDQLRYAHDELREAIDLAQAFADIVRYQEKCKFVTWLAQAKASTVTALARFANSLESDFDAVTAALSLPWSNGPVEGYINKLKMLKRSMFGRAKFDLLEKRLLHVL